MVHLTQNATILLLYIFSRGNRGGGHSHWPVCVMRLSIDHVFCIACTPNAPFFHNFTPNDPNFANRCENFFKNARILCNFTPNDPPFSDLSPNDPFFTRKLSPIAPWFDASVGAPPSFLYVSAPPPPPRGNTLQPTFCAPISKLSTHSVKLMLYVLWCLNRMMNTTEETPQRDTSREKSFQFNKRRLR